jgi:hypothetical protein
MPWRTTVPLLALLALTALASVPHATAQPLRYTYQIVDVPPRRPVGHSPCAASPIRAHSPGCFSAQGARVSAS